MNHDLAGICWVISVSAMVILVTLELIKFRNQKRQ